MTATTTPMRRSPTDTSHYPRSIVKRRLLLLNARRGLGNRVRAVLSGLAYAEATGCRLWVVWAPNQQCGAGIDQLWEHPLTLMSLQRARWLARASGGWEEHLTDDDMDLARFRRPVLALQSSQAFSNPRGLAWPVQLHQFTPIAEIRDRIAAHWPALDTPAPLVGLMVRAHHSAHAHTTASQPVEYALQRLAAIHALAPTTKVFLSCDSPEASERIRAAADVLELPGKGEFNSVRGVQDAVCDLYLLASCQWIVGSHQSSFSEIAGLVAGHGGYETARARATASLTERLAAPRRQPADFWP